MTRYVITGSTGHISKPVAEALTASGGAVTVISSSESRRSEIESLGAKAAIGSVSDVAFLRSVFGDADAVYLMIPPNYAAPDFAAYQKEVADAYVSALRESRVSHVVVLSSIGAHLRKGAGPIDALGYLEAELEQLPQLQVKVLRPSYFFYNLYAQQPLIKGAGITGGNLNNDREKIVLVHHLDIAERVTAHLKDLGFTGYSIEYVASDERHAEEIAAVLGRAVNKEGLSWVSFTDEQALEGMLQGGLHPSLAESYVTMGRAFREGRIQEDYWKSGPKELGRRKLEDFAREFAQAYHAS